MPRYKCFTPLLGNQTKNRHGQITTKVSFAAYSEFVDLINIRVLTRVTVSDQAEVTEHAEDISCLASSDFTEPAVNKLLFLYSI